MNLKMNKKFNTKKVTSIRQMLTDAVKEIPNHIAYSFKKDGQIISVTNSEFYGDVESLGAYLTEKGFGYSHIACIGENSYKWIVTFLTALMSGGVFVPIDKELSEEGIVYLLNESDSEVVLCGRKYADIISKHKDELNKIKLVIPFEKTEGCEITFDEAIENGRNLDKTKYDSLKSDENNLKYLVYTSGTTGVAKGVMLTEHNICSGIYYGMQVSQITDKGLSVLPYNHTYEAVCDILVAINSHATICINDSIRKVQENLKLFKPSYIYLVPAFSEYFYNNIMKSIKKKGIEKKFNAALNFSQALRKIGIDARRTIFADIHKEFGGNLVKIVCGGAPIRPEVGRFFDKIGISLTGGYGITECSPLVSVNDDNDNNYASAGHKLSCLEWKTVDCDSDGNGEICVKGDVVMKGYYKRPDLTKEAIIDGWFHTGDYGHINEKNEIVITGRKKNIVVLNNGKNIYPEEIESYIVKIDGVNEVIVSGIKNEFGQDMALQAEIYTESEITKEAFSKRINEALRSLPIYKQISSVTLRYEPFPKTTTNKIKRA